MTATSIDLRHAREIEHFNRVYSDEAKTDSLVLRAEEKSRYLSPPATTIFSKEYCYHLMGSLRGKKVLEIACGNGTDTCLMASLGAEVYAYDISEEAIRLTEKRALANGLGDKVHLVVSGDVMDAFNGETFDVIVGFAALHHLPLEGLSEQLRSRLNPGGVAVFQEPVVNSEGLDRLRQKIPFRVVEVTDDEEPLNDASIATLAKSFNRIERREFECVSRIYPLVSSKFLRRALFRLDRALMHLKPLRRFASVVCFGLYRDADAASANP